MNITNNSSFVKEVTFDQLFIDYATKNFDKIAAVYGDIQITYQELYDKAHLLASHLIDLPQEAPVVVILDRSIDLLVSMLGIWMAGAVFVEYIFSWKGIGYEVFEALTKNDLPVVMGATLIFATIFVVTNIFVDIAYGVLDPRVRVK